MTTVSSSTLAVYRAISVVNEGLRPEDQLAERLSQPIIGDKASLDSLGLVQLLVAVEAELEASLGISLPLTLELTQPDAGVQTIGELVTFIERSSERSKRAAS